MAKKRDQKRRTGEPYVRVHKGYWHLYYRNPDPARPYPAHKSLRLHEGERDKAEVIEAEARLIWKQCSGEFDHDPTRIGIVFDRFIEEKTDTRKAHRAEQAESRYLEETLGDVLAEFLAAKQGKAKRTREHYASHIKHIKRLMDVGKPIAEVDEDDVRRFLEARVGGEDVHKTTGNKYLTTLRSVFGFAQKRGYVERSPAAMVEKFSLEPKYKEELEEPVYIPPEVYEALLRARAARRHRPIRAVMFLLYHTGMRIGELLRLRWRDVNIERNVIHVTATPQKGGDRDPYMVSRQLRVYLRVARRLAQRAHERDEWGAGVPFGRIAVVPNGNGRPWTYTNLSNRAWAPFMEAFSAEKPAVYAKLKRLADQTDPHRRPISFHDFHAPWTASRRAA